MVTCERLNILVIFAERVVRTMYEMGTAVFYGGFSTFLAFILLAASKSYIFKTFFKVNTNTPVKQFLFQCMFYIKRCSPQNEKPFEKIYYICVPFVIRVCLVKR